MLAKLHHLYPHCGMTISSGELEINVHWVNEEAVGYGYYRAEEELPLRLERRPITVFIESVERAVSEGCWVFTKVNLTPGQ